MWASRRGFSLVELMIAAALMALVTALVAVIVQGTLYRSRVMEDKQSALQQFVLLREQLNISVRNSRLLLADSTPTELHFVRANQEETPYGNLDRVSFAETTSWDDTKVFVVKVHRRAGQDLIVQYQRGEPEDGPTSRVLSRLGRTGSCEFSYDELPLLRIKVSGESARRGGTQSWTRDFKILLENYS